MGQTLNNTIKRLIKLISNALNILKIKDNRIYLACLDGKKYGFDQRAFAEYVIRTHPSQFEFIWEYTDTPPDTSEMPSCMSIVKAKTLKQIIAVKTSHYVVYNINPHDYIGYRKRQVLVNTWHGFGIKEHEGLFDQETIERFRRADMFCSYSEWFTNWFILGTCGFEGCIIKSGAAKNDLFFDSLRYCAAKEKARKALDIPTDTKVVLYAPTFRGNFELFNYDIDFKTISSVFEESFGGKWTCLVRYHPLVSQVGLYTDFGKSAIDVTSYDDMQELLCLADALISDYSGCVWDFAQTRKPIFLYIPDVENYIADRGFSVPLHDLPYPYALSEFELVKRIRDYNQSVYVDNLERFFKNLGSYENGNASKRIYEAMIAFASSNK